MSLIIFFALCLIDIILFSIHWYIPFFLLSLYLFWSFCVGIYYYTRPTKQDKIKALENLLDYYHFKDTGKHIDWNETKAQE